MPSATVIDAGSVATAVLELVRVTTAPPAAAVPLKDTRAVVEFPPITEAVVISRLDMAVGFTLTAPEYDTPFSVAVMVTRVEIGTGYVDALKRTLVAPAGTVAVGGTAMIDGSELLREIVTGAEALVVRTRLFPFSGIPPAMLVAESTSPDNPGAATVRVADPI